MLTECPFCFESLEGLNAGSRANHVRWCKLNPKRNEYLNSKKAPVEFTDEVRRKISEGLKKAWSEGVYDNMTASKKGVVSHTQSQASREKISAAQRKLTYRRLMRYTREYVCKDGSKVLLDSSWEEELAKRLDYLDVHWIRPSFIEWIDQENKSRKYFPDFYLPEYDIYIDPKNPAAEASQKEKLKIIGKMLPNLIILRSLQECKEYSPAPTLVS